MFILYTFDLFIYAHNAKLDEDGGCKDTTSSTTPYSTPTTTPTPEVICRALTVVALHWNIETEKTCSVFPLFLSLSLSVCLSVYLFLFLDSFQDNLYHFQTILKFL